MLRDPPTQAPHRGPDVRAPDDDNRPEPDSVQTSVLNVTGGRLSVFGGIPGRSQTHGLPFRRCSVRKSTFEKKPDYGLRDVLPIHDCRVSGRYNEEIIGAFQAGLLNAHEPVIGPRDQS